MSTEVGIRLGEVEYNSIIEFIRTANKRLNHLSFGVITCEYSIYTIQNKDEYHDVKILSDAGIESLLTIRKAKASQATLRLLYDDKLDGNTIQVSITLSGSQDFIESALYKMRYGK